MPSVDELFLWLTALPPLALYASAFALAFVESVFPPFPADMGIAICAFVAAPGEASLGVTYASVLFGNVGGAAVTYGLARRYGATGLKARMAKHGWLEDEEKLERMYAKYGIVGMFIGRFIPGVRGVVPMVAGAMRVGAWRTMSVVAVAAAAWYGLLTGIAYRVGDNWDEYSRQITALGKAGTVAGAVLGAIGIGFGVWLWRRKRLRDRTK
jgi:membrane protein DedA with SNARE-associated domain